MSKDRKNSLYSQEKTLRTKLSKIMHWFCCCYTALTSSHIEPGTQWNINSSVDTDVFETTGDFNSQVEMTDLRMQ